MKKSSLHSTVILTTLTIVLYACGSGSDKHAELEKLKKEQATLKEYITALEAEIAQSDTSKNNEKSKLVAIKEMKPETFKHYIEIQAKVDGDEDVIVSPESMGNITSLQVQAGDRVVKGQLIATIDDRMNRQGVAEAQTQLDLATQVFNRQKNLWDQKIGSEIQFLQAKTNKEALSATPPCCCATCCRNAWPEPEPEPIAMNPAKVVRERVRVLTDLPNIGRTMAAELQRLAKAKPAQLKGRDPYVLYQERVHGDRAAAGSLRPRHLHFDHPLHGRRRSPALVGLYRRTLGGHAATTRTLTRRMNLIIQGGALPTFLLERIVTATGASAVEPRPPQVVYLKEASRTAEFDALIPLLLVGQFNLRSQLIQLIKDEIEFAKQGLASEITLKLNALQDEEMISLLYEASQAGVKIKLIIRGICSLIPGVKGFSENIEAISIIDRYLEHARVYVFHHGGEQRVYLSSADWMVRNLSYRIEVAFPIYDPKVKQEILDLLQLQWNDNIKARVIDVKLNNQYKDHGDDVGIRSQIEAYHYLKRLNEINYL